VSITKLENVISKTLEKSTAQDVHITEEIMMIENVTALGLGSLKVNTYVIPIGNWFPKTENNG